MIEKWNQFVYDLCEAKRKDVDEDSYHALIETQLQLLGWAKYKGEICHKPNVPIGNSKFIQPDILVKKDGEDQFVIEVKRPVHTQTERERVQLESYMRQLKLDVGIYVGECIEIFYDKPRSRDAVSVLNISLEIDNKQGAKFVEYFSKEQFSKDAIVSFCESRILEMQRQANLNKIKEGLIGDAQKQITESLVPYLMEKYGDSFSEEEVKGMLSQLRFYVNTAEDSQQHTHQEIRPFFPDSEIPDTTMKRVYDNTEFSLDGGDFLGKNRFVYAVVSKYVHQHPEATFADVEKVFPPDLQGSFGVVKTMDYIKQKNYNGHRYFNDSEHVLCSSDNILFAVSNQWGKGNIGKFLEVAKKLGYQVATSLDSQSDKDTAGKQNNGIKEQNPEGKIFHLKVRGSDANAVFNENDFSMRILKGSIIPRSTAPSYRDGAKRNAIIASISKSVNDDFWELQSDYVLNSPSTAASYCSGRSCNGWLHWVNDEGWSLDELYRE